MRKGLLCGYCEIQRPENKEKLKTFGVTFKDGKIISKGKSAHGSTPELGIVQGGLRVQYFIAEVLRAYTFGDFCGVESYGVADVEYYFDIIFAAAY